jgi:pimeloyl-ACP methyl ester carboxylesterase
MHTLMAVAFLCSPFLFASDQPLSQDWVGELQIGGSKRFVQLKMTGDHGSMTGKIAFPASGQADTPLSDVTVKQGHMRFAWKDDAGQAWFDGGLADGLLSGTVRAGDKQGTLQLAPTTTLPAEAQQRLIGYYEMRPGEILSVTSFPMGLVYVDYSTGRAGVLFPSSQDAFFAGPAFQVAVPMAIKCRISGDPVANLTRLDWQGPSGERNGRKLDLQRDEVTFQDGNVALSGTLVLPSSKGPHPAIVRIQGSGPQTRRNVVDGWYAYHGIAYLSYDKRGVGKSTGDWREAGISELADDVVAAVHYLRQRKDIDPDQIGIEADSEGGWIAPVVATRDPKIKFIVMMAGPAMDYVAELMNEVQERVKARGLSGEDLLQALAFKQKALQMIADGAGLNDEAWARFQAFLAPYRNEPWYSYVSEPKERGPAQKKLYLMARVRSSEYWRQVKIPVLALYGGKDLSVPAAKNVAALTQELQGAGNHDYTITILPEANHDGLDASSALLDNEQVRYLQRYAPGYFDTQMSWVLSHCQSRVIPESKSQSLHPPFAAL